MLFLAPGEKICWPTACHFENGSFDDVEFIADVLVVGREVGEGADNDEGFLLIALQDQPAWGLWERKHEDDNDESEDYFEGDGEPPGEGGLGVVAPQTYPVGYAHTTGDEGAFHKDKEAAAVRFGSFGLPCWHRRRIDAVAKAEDCAAGNELSEGEGACLDDGADDHEDGAQKDGLTAAEDVGNEDT